MAVLSWAEELWLFSLLLAGIALAIMVGLVLGRLVSGHLSSARENDRRRWLRIVLGDGPELPAGRWKRGATKPLADLSVELIQLVRGSDREAFIERAGRLGVPALLRHRLDSGSARVRLSGAEALAQFPDARSLERLREALGDPSAAVRLSAALSLAHSGHAPSALILVDKLGIGTRETSRLIVALFREIARQRPDELRKVVLSASVAPAAKAAAIEALSASGDYSLVQVVTDLALAAPEESPELPRFLRALAGFGHPAAEPAVRRALASPAWEARAAAARGAGRIGLAGLAPRLADLLGDPEWWVRFRAGEALTKLGDTGLEQLRAAAASSESAARTAATLTLSERGLA